MDKIETIVIDSDTDDYAEEQHQQQQQQQQETQPPPPPPSLSQQLPTQQQAHLIQTEQMDVDNILPDQTSIAETRKNEGNEQYKAQNYTYAIRLYSDAIALCPQVPSYYGNRSACYMMLGDYRSALADCRLATQLDTGFEKGFVRIAKCCVATGDITAAEQAIQKLRDLDPNNVAITSEMSNCKQLKMQDEKATQYYKEQDYRRSIFHLDRALNIAPAAMKYKLIKAECLVWLGRIEQASDLAISCMKIDSTNAEAIYVRGLCLYYNDNLEKGLNHFEQALKLDPDNTKARTMRLKARSLKEKKEKGNELFKTGKFNDAQAIYTEALAIDALNKDTNSKLFCNRAIIHSKMGRHAEAIKDCTCSLNESPNYLKALLLRAKCYQSNEEYEQSVNDYETAYKMDKTIATKQLLQEAKLALKKSKRKDYYKILGIDKNANETDIKKAYRKRALVHHPDRHANASEEVRREQEKKFKEVGEAYTILSDQNKKIRYDSGQDIDDQGDYNFQQAYRQYFQFTSNNGQFFDLFS